MKIFVAAMLAAIVANMAAYWVVSGFDPGTTLGWVWNHTQIVGLTSALEADVNPRAAALSGAAAVVTGVWAYLALTRYARKGKRVDTYA